MRTIHETAPLKIFRHPALRTWLNWGVTVLIVALLFYWVPVGEAWISLRMSNPVLLAAAASLTLVNVLCRGMRWLLITGPGVGNSEKRACATMICAIALTMNAVLPAKAGEIARIVLAKRHLDLSIGRATSAVLVERLFDSVVLLLLATVAVAYTDFASGAAEIKQVIQSLSLITALILISAVLLGNERANHFARRLIFGVLSFDGVRRFRRPGVSFVVELGCGMRRLAFRDMLIVLLVTILIWVALGIGVYLTSLAAPGVALSPAAALAFAALTVLVTAVPSAPGGWGIFEAAGIALVFATADNTVTAADAASFTLAVHLVQYIPVVVSGSVAWLLLRYPRHGHGG